MTPRKLAEEIERHGLTSALSTMSAEDFNEARKLVLAALRAGTVTDEMVNRFLAWPLPASVSADLCATRPDYPHQRIGTNLLTATEARQMLEHVLAGGG